MSKKNEMKTFDDMIRNGSHVLIIQDAAQVTVQPLTKKGLMAIISILEDAGTDLTEFSEQLSKKQDGHYVAALPLQNTPHQIAGALAAYGISGPTAIAYMRTEQEIDTRYLDDAIH